MFHSFSKTAIRPTTTNYLFATKYRMQTNKITTPKLVKTKEAE